MGRKYSIAIQAHGDDFTDAPPKISAVMQVDEDGTLQLVELTVGAVDGGPIPPSVARQIDFELLAHALSGVVVATLSPPEEGSDAAEPAVAADAPEESEESEESAHPTPPPAEKERPYRRMPDIDEVRQIIQQTRSVGKLAQHFDVPRYTAQAWVDRLRRTGQLDDDRQQSRS